MGSGQWIVVRVGGGTWWKPVSVKSNLAKGEGGGADEEIRAILLPLEGVSIFAQRKIQSLAASTALCWSVSCEGWYCEGRVENIRVPGGYDDLFTKESILSLENCCRKRRCGYR